MTTYILMIATTLFFSCILAASVYALWSELSRDIQPYSKGDDA